MLMGLAGLLMATVIAAPAADVKGKWDGTLLIVAEDGTKRQDTVLLILDQKENEITGTAGGGESDQHPITKGAIDGNKVVLRVTPANGRELRLELVLEDDTMNGSVTRGQQKAEVHVKRQKP